MFRGRLFAPRLFAGALFGLDLGIVPQPQPDAASNAGGGRRRPRPNPYAAPLQPAEPDALAARRARIRVQALVIAEAL